MKERFFITGGMGYIGSAFAQEALRQGHDVCLYDSLMYEQDPARMLEEISKYGQNGASLKLVIGDNRNSKLLKDSLQEFSPSYVLHLGELSSVYSCDHNPVFSEAINYTASTAVLDLCAELGYPVIYNSSSSVYGTQKENRLMKESDPLPSPTDYYCRHKLRMEEYIKQKTEQMPEFRIIVLRLATIFGLSPRFRIELLPNHFTYMAISKNKIQVANPDAYRAALDMSNLIKAYFCILGKGEWDELVYNVGQLNMSKKEFAEGVQHVTGCEIGLIPDIGDRRNLQIDSSLFENEFNFHPSTSYEDSIMQIAAWIRDNKDRVETNNFAEMLNMPLDKWLKLCN